MNNKAIFQRIMLVAARDPKYMPTLAQGWIHLEF